MLDWVFELLWLLLGFVLLAKGADGLVDGGVALARRWGVDPLLVGLTIVAWGTSMPELVVSSLAAWDGRGAMSLGNVLGSNVANIGLVLGASAVILPAVVVGQVRAREIVWLIGSLFALWFACRDGVLSRVEGTLLVMGFLLYMELLRRHPRVGSGVPEMEAVVSHAWPRVILGSLAIVGGAKLVVMGGEALAYRAGLSEMVVGLVLFALGTSLPELAAGVGSALKGHADIGYGNVIGSNVFNVMAAIGTAAVVRPIGGEGGEAVSSGVAGVGVMQEALTRDFPVALAFSAILLLMPFVAPGRRGRNKGWLLVSAYLAYVGWLLVA